MGQEFVGGNEKCRGLSFPPKFTGKTGDKTGDKTGGTAIRASSPGAEAKTGTGTGTGEGTGKAEKETRPRLVSINVPGVEPTVKKPRKPRATKAKDGIDPAQVEALLITTFAVLATRPNFEALAITKSEAEQIAAPLTAILNKSDAFKSVAEHSDAIALTVACATIFVPKVYVTYEKAHKTKKKEVKPDAGYSGTEKANVGSGGKPAERKSAGDADYRNGVLADLPSIA